MSQNTCLEPDETEAEAPEDDCCTQHKQASLDYAQYHCQPECLHITTMDTISSDSSERN